MTVQPFPSARTPGPDPARLLDDLKRIAVEHLAVVPGELYEPIERQLNDALRLGTSLSTRHDLKTILTLRQRNATYVMRYRDLIARGFDDFRGRGDRVRAVLPMDLVGESELGVQLAGQRLAESIARRYQRPLELLERRLEALADVLGIEAGTNPIGAVQLAGVFLRTFGDAQISDSLQPLMFRHYDLELSKVLGDLYQRLNSRLAVNGFTADGGRHAPQPVAVAKKPARPGAQPTSAAGSGMEADRSDPCLQRHRELCSLVHDWRAARAGARTPSGAQPPVRHLRATELASVAALMQRERHPGLEAALDGEGNLADVLRERLLEGARRLGIDPDLVPLGDQEAEAIDLVALVFQAMVQSHALASEGRRLFARLSLPYVKVALADQRVFLDAEHPARRFADALALSCEDLDPDSPQAGDLMQSATAAVERVIVGYNEDLAVFELATSELQDLLEQQRRRAEIVERRSVETVHGRERLRQARVLAGATLARHVAGVSLTTAVFGFLQDQWSHHLMQVILRDGEGSERHVQVLLLADQLIAVDQAAARCERDAVVRGVVAIRPALVECLSSAGLDAAAANEWMAGLARTLAFPDSERQQHDLPAMPSLADESDDTRLLQLVAGSASLEFDPEVAERLRALAPGAWLRLVDEEGAEGAVKVAWTSPLTARLLLVNRRGIRKLVASPEQLAALVRVARLSLEADHMPFDEALRQVRHRLGEAAAAA
ncbi:MAG: DUF1631 family protein [Luteimonas sp.]